MEEEFELMADFEAKIGSALANLCKSGLFDPEEALILLDTYKNHFAISISVFCKQRHSDEGEDLKPTESHTFQSLRERTGLTQEQLSEKVNVTRSAVAMWEAGEALPRADTLLALSKVLGCTTDELLDSLKQQ